MPKAVIISGPPGAGKGTQADLIASHFGFIHFDTGRYVESVVKERGGKRAADRKRFDKGGLADSAWVLRVVKEQVRMIARAGLGVVLSGSPRTRFEAFGNLKTRGLLATLAKLYGKKNVVIIRITVPPQVSVRRNSKRFVCSVCGRGNLLGDKVKTCPYCGGKLVKRTLDKPEVIRVRLREYKERTEPIYDEAKKKGYRVLAVKGDGKPAEVFARIAKHVK